MESTLYRGEIVYIRSYSTRRAAIAQVINPAPEPGSDYVEVRLVTDWYAWDADKGPNETRPHAGDQMRYASYRLEEVRA